MYALNSSVDYGKTLGFLDALEFGGQMILIGMVAVFTVLGLIWVLLSIFKIVFTNVNGTESSQKIQAVSPVITPVYTATESEIVAVITAAIAMAESESDDNIKFKVVSFRKK